MTLVLTTTHAEMMLRHVLRKQDGQVSKASLFVLWSYSTALTSRQRVNHISKEEKRRTYNENTTTPQRRLSRIILDASEYFGRDEDIIAIFVADCSVETLVGPLKPVFMCVLEVADHQFELIIKENGLVRNA